MNQQRPHAQEPAPAQIADCWNTIGVRGDASCSQLDQHIHCRNCPVYGAAAARLLDADPPSEYLKDWTRQVARPAVATEHDMRALLLFRVGAEWLALTTSVLQEIAHRRAIHAIPHRRNGAVLGLANVRGELLVCVSLQHILGVAAEPVGPNSQSGAQRLASQRLLVIQREDDRAVCPVDEIHGIERFSPQAMGPVPTTVAKAAATYTRAVLSWQQKTVGVLDDPLLFHTINRSLT